MASITENELKLQIKEKSPAPCYLFYGAEDYLKQFYTNKIISAFVEKGSETFCLRKYDGKDNSLDEVLEGALSLPFMGERTVVIARDFPLDTLPSAQKEQLSQFLDDLPDSSVTVFWFDNIEVNPKNAKWKKVLDEFREKAVTVDFTKPQGSQLRKLLCAYAGRQGGRMSAGEADFLVELCGDNLNTLFNEIQKVCAYAGEGAEITREHILAVAVPSTEAKVFDLSKHILNRSPKKALEILNTLMRQKAEPVDIFGVILMSFTDIYRVKAAVSAGQSATYPAKFYDYKNKEFRLRNAERTASRLSNEEIRSMLDCLAEADRSLKSTGEDGAMVLERLIIQLSLILAG